MDQSNSRDGNSSVSNSVSTFSPVARLKFERWLDERLYTAESPIHGTGLFTRAPIERGEILMKWGGVLVPVGATDPTLYRSSSTTRYDAFYYLTTPMTEPRTLDEWLNHSCDPNTWMEGDSRTVSARRDIEANSEITMDYALWSEENCVYADPCTCGVLRCRRKVTGLDWRRADLQIRYRDHFIPWLNERITARRLR